MGKNEINSPFRNNANLKMTIKYSNLCTTNTNIDYPNIY